VEAFNTLLEAKVLVEDWRIEYDTVRPHSALGYLTPSDYTKAWTAARPDSQSDAPTTGGPSHAS
jgi:putative transposase